MNPQEVKGASVTIASATRWAQSVKFWPAHSEPEPCPHDHMAIDAMNCRVDSELAERLLFLGQSSTPTAVTIHPREGEVMEGFFLVEGIVFEADDKVGVVHLFLTKTDEEVTEVDIMFSLSERMEEAMEAHGDYHCGGLRMTHTESLVVLMREVGEVAESIRIGNQDHGPVNTKEHLKDELLDVAAAALLWAGSL